MHSRTEREHDDEPVASLRITVGEGEDATVVDVEVRRPPPISTALAADVEQLIKRLEDPDQYVDAIDGPDGAIAMLRRLTRELR